MPDCVSCDDPFSPHKCAECGVVVDRCHECHIEVVHGRLGEAAGAGWATTYPADMQREWGRLSPDPVDDSQADPNAPDQDRYDPVTE